MKNKPTIEEMAYQYLNIHPNDKSGVLPAKMQHRFGYAQSRQAISDMANTILLLDPNHKKSKDWLKSNRRYL